jgi:hypothetical protein
MGPQEKKDESRPHESGAGSSGEGAGSALEALLRKRQMRVDPPPDPAGPPASQKQDGPPLKE